MTTFAQEAEQRMRESSLKWIARVKKEDPERARLYCDHGIYIGSNGLFHNRCKSCQEGR